MSKTKYRFEIPKHKTPIIKVIGVGGGGSNAVSNMYKMGIKDVSFIVCNTDAQALESSSVPQKLQIGINLTSGLGAGANPEVGKNAAIESKDEIQELLSSNTKMVFITSGMGGGTGTGAAPIIASLARKLDILTVGIVTMPFSFEGEKKRQRAQEGIASLKEHCDTVLVILNDKLKETLGNLSIADAFAQADNVLTTAAKSIAEIITVPGYVNVDFEDVKTVMKNAGAAVMGSAVSEGENRCIEAAKNALNSPLLDHTDIHGAKKILLSIVSGSDAELQMNELTTITDYIQERVGVDSEVIFGHGSDPQLKDKIRVTVIATGFDNESPKNTNKNPNNISIAGPDYKKVRTPNEYYAAKNIKRKTSFNEAFMAATDEDFAEHKEYFHKKAQEIADSIKNKITDTSDEELRHKIEVPAYLRKNVSLEYQPNPEQKISIYELDNEE
jgi:cell division protein FtsZ